MLMRLVDGIEAGLEEVGIIRIDIVHARAPETADGLGVSVEHQLPLLTPDLAEAEEEPSGRLSRRAGDSDRRRAGVDERTARLPRRCVRPRLSEGNRIRTSGQCERLLERFHRRPRLVFGDGEGDFRRLSGLGIDLTAECDGRLADRRVDEDVLQDGGTALRQRHRREEVTSLGHVVTPAVTDAGRPRAEALVGGEETDLIRLAILKNGRHVDKALRGQHHTRALAVHEDHEFDATDFLLKGDERSLPIRGHVHALLIPAGVGVVVGIGGLSALTDGRERHESAQRQRLGHPIDCAAILADVASAGRRGGRTRRGLTEEIKIVHQLVERLLRGLFGILQRLRTDRLVRRLEIDLQRLSEPPLCQVEGSRPGRQRSNGQRGEKRKAKLFHG